MKKLALKIDDLAVESFPTVQGEHDARGTVHGNAGDSTNTAERSCNFTQCRVDCPTNYFMNTICYIP